ncbi:class I SAM-dependent methyltransferase [Pseudonocardia humida]|uniref:Methyltransferase domain-containing protein n=1 Tax=Pseudonocardia humida TaxID=2800819 RepID=A0ABT0ZWB3_9PSEU|nr:class I SAM-dependent methyltransferase [Pseudonocardia humida]MCO1655032.1 methyltransferase domain-containing protein [Pseudonocardia humida]
MDATTAHSDTDRPYLPGMGKDILIPFYDVVHRVFRVGRLHAEMVRRAELEPGQRVLDIGCGTGNLLLALGARRPDLDLAGIDPDPKALARATRKARRAGVAVRFDRGFADTLPYPDGSVDRVFSSLMLHHLDPPVKDATLAEVRRVLRPGGALVLADFDGHGQGHGRGHGHRRLPFGRRMEVSQRLRENAGIADRIAAAGLVPDEPAPFELRVGTVAIVRAARRS